MGVVKGDRLGRSGKLAKLPLTSALAYSWVVSVPRARDDFGAFQWDPGLIRATCFPLRPAVTVEMIEAWLAEWLEVGLLLRYRDGDGVELGVFTNFQGEPQPRFHRFDLPPELAHECRLRCAKSGMRVLSKQRIINKKERQRNARGTLGKSASSVPSVLPSLPSSSPPLPTVPITDNGNVGLKPDDPLLDAALEVFQYWRLETNHRRSQRTPGRLAVLRARLREEPGTVEEKVAGLKLAVDGALRDPWFNGAETGRTYLDFDNVFKNKGRDRIEKLQRLAQSPERPRGDSAADRVDAKVAGLVRRARGAPGGDLPPGEEDR